MDNTSRRATAPRNGLHRRSPDRRQDAEEFASQILARLARYRDDDVSLCDGAASTASLGHFPSSTSQQIGCLSTQRISRYSLAWYGADPKANGAPRTEHTNKAARLILGLAPLANLVRQKRGGRKLQIEKKIPGPIAGRGLAEVKASSSRTSVQCELSSGFEFSRLEALRINAEAFAYVRRGARHRRGL
jgi:hypothetical protein